MTESKSIIKSYLDLTRAHFAPIWPLFFISGLVLAFQNYGGFSWRTLILAGLIGLFGFETGMVWNDILDHKIDEKDVERDKLTRYWRPFGERPIPSGQIKYRQALIFNGVLLVITIGLIALLPSPHRWYVYLFMPITYGLESFYNLKKRHEKFPWAQILGRMDFALFPVVGYLVHGHLDQTCLLYFLFFYPFALIHLGVNDLVDIKNDKARKVNTITTLYDIKGTLWWITGFSLTHFVTAIIFLSRLGAIARIGFAIGFGLLIIANLIMLSKKTPVSALKALPFVHATLFVYIISIYLDAAF